jgi:hypothetical protein
LFISGSGEAWVEGANFETVDATLFAGRTTITVPVNNPAVNFVSSFVLVPGFVEQGDLAHSLVNNIPAFNGGSHIDAFRKYFVSNLLTVLSREIRKRSLTPNRSDILETLLIYNVTQMNRPDFDEYKRGTLVEGDINLLKFNELVAWSMGGFRVGMINEIGGLGQYNERYGYIEHYCYDRLKPKGYDFYLLADHYDLSLTSPDPQYEEWKRLSRTNQINVSFSDWLGGRS